MKEKLKILNEFVLKCNDILITSQNNDVKKAREYILKRNINEDSIKNNIIGFCPYSDNIPEEVKFFNIDKDNKEHNKNGFSYYIKSRIIIPIHDEFSNVVAFATRKPSFEEGETWWNLPFKKNNYLYLLNKSRKDIFTNNKVYMVEGYVDAIILKQYGINEVVSLMGTKLSIRKISLLLRYCDNFCFCLDMDKNNAGQNALKNNIYMLKEMGMYNSLSIIDGLPIGEDPDVFVNKNGKDSLLKLEKVLSEKEILKIYNEIKESKKR